MRTRHRLLAGLAGAAVLVTGFALPAAAQPYYGDRRGSYDEGYAYDPCRRARTERGTGGALVGGGLGALAGSGIAGRGAKTEGAVIGGILGAIVGGNVGSSSAACQDGTYREPVRPTARYDDRYGDRNSYAYRSYDNRDDGYADSGYGDEDDGYYGGGYSSQVRTADPDGCSLAESPIYLPDGTVTKRFVRVCRDSSGRYQVVD